MKNLDLRDDPEQERWEKMGPCRPDAGKCEEERGSGRKEGKRTKNQKRERTKGSNDNGSRCTDKRT